MIEKLETEKLHCLDFIQEPINRKIVEKINEIIEYINKENEGDK